MRIRVLLPVALVVALAAPPVWGLARPLPSETVAATGIAGTEFAPPAPRGHLDSTLDDVVSAYLSGGSRDMRSTAAETGVDVDGSLVQVAIYAKAGRKAALLSAIAGVGGRTDGTAEDLVMADIPVGRLVRFSEDPSIRSIFAPPKPEELAVTSQGIAALNVPAWARATPEHPALTGAGVKVGVLDAGFNGYETLLGTELPPAAQVHMWTGAPADDTSHGAAVAEVIHDVAPDSELYLAAVHTPVQLNQALDWMASQGVTVINMSLGWHAWSRVDGTGPVNAPFDRAVAQGITCSFSAANSRRRHWSGNFVGGNEPFPEQFLHNWKGADQENQFTVTTVPYLVDGWLWWDDWATASQDYNLQLVRWTGSTWEEVRQSRDSQSVTRVPVEHISAELTQTGTYGWRIWRAAATRTDVDFDLFIIKGSDLVNKTGHAYNTSRRSVLQPGDNKTPGAITVAATGFGPKYTLESYSSEGPTIDGRNGIDISNPTVVDTVSYGPSTFNGTSAAAPHIAGLAALVRQAEPSLTPAEIEQYLYAQSIDLGAKGLDPLYGRGRVWLKKLPGLSASAKPSVVGYGKRVTVKGALMAGGKAVGGQKNVTLWRRLAGSSTWKKVATAQWSSSARKYQAMVPLTSNATLQLRFGGSGTLAPRRSAEVTAAVKASLSPPVVPAQAPAARRSSSR